MRKVLFFWLLAVAGQAQTLKIFDLETREPLSNVLVWQDGTREQSDGSGQVSLTEFDRTTPITIQHIGYSPQVWGWEDLEKYGFQVFLEESIQATEQIVISASRWEESLDEVTAQVVRLSEKDIARIQPQTTADLVSASGKVYVQKSQMGGGSPMLRGFAANSVLLVVDGVRMNNAIFRGGNLQNLILLDPNTISRTEIILGSSSVLYGSDALGGVIHTQTRNPTKDLQGAFLLRYASANHEKTAHAQVSFGKNDFRFFTSLTFSDFDDLRTGNWRPNYPDFGKRTEYVVRRDGEDVIVPNDNINLQRFSGYWQANILQKIQWRNWKYSLQYSTSSDIPRYDRLIERRNGQLRSAEWYYGPQNWLMQSLRYQHDR
ncbi:MAG: TonB-dependent receptor plug domain-containing protein, partial [Bacteroidota bacterium]